MLYNLKQLYARVSYVKPNKIIIIMMEAPKAWMNAKCKNRPFVNYYGRVIFNVEENAVKDLTHSPSLHFKSVCRWIDKTHELYLKRLIYFDLKYNILGIWYQVLLDIEILFEIWCYEIRYSHSFVILLYFNVLIRDQNCLSSVT